MARAFVLAGSLMLTCALAETGRAAAGDGVVAPPPPSAQTGDDGARLAGALVAAYPDFLSAYENGDIVWKDGTRMPFGSLSSAASAGTAEDPSTARSRLAEPMLADMMREPYPAGVTPTAPPPTSDPGRVRVPAFFDKMYGDCSKGWSGMQLVDVRWLPRKWGRTVRFAAANGAAAALQRVSAELDALPARFDAFLFPPAGTLNCRVIAGTTRRSAHGWGIAIDIATRQSDYWRWAGGGAIATDWGPVNGWRNRVPAEIVAIFEKHGFVWGGRWAHYDTMHFEYRPELLSAARAR